MLRMKDLPLKNSKFLFYKHSLKVKWNNLLFSNYTFYKVPHFDQGIIVYICFDETFRKFINFINCPLTEKEWGAVKLSHVWNIVTTYSMYLNALRTLIEVEVIQSGQKLGKIGQEI
jgi:hypothetical protein